MKLKNLLFSESTDQDQMEIIKIQDSSQIPNNFTGVAEFENSPIDWKNGGKIWVVNREFHRENDLPAVEWLNGTKEWWLNGKRHRENDLPAIEWPNGTKEWYINGKPHRENGPAVEYANGTKEWYFNGIKRKEEDWKKLVKNRHQNPNDILLESIKVVF